jgi:PAS domain S-box-containing protein
MSLITILWSMAAAAALTLGVVHALVWVSDRSARSNLMFSIVAVAFACMAPIELRLMHAHTPEEYGIWVRWIHVPIFFGITATILFVRHYLGTGRTWLAWLIIALRCVVLVANFATHPNFNFSEISSISQVAFLGEEVSTVGETTVGSWQWLATASTLLFTVFVLDAAVTLWRRGGRDAKRKAVVVGGGIVTFVAISVGQTQMVIWGISHIPVLVSPPFLITVVAMAFELSRDLLRAARLARDLRDSEQRLDLATSAAGLGIWVWDIAGRKVQTTDKARALYGVQGDKVIDFDRWIDPIHADDVAALRRDVQRALASGDECASEYRVRLPDGTVRWIAARGCAEFGPDGRPTVLRGIVRDISESKQAQAETEQLRRELAHAGRVTLLGQLSSALAHELNQPLGAILRNAEAAAMLLEAPVPDIDELRAIVADIRKDDRRAGDVIDRLYTLLRRRSVELRPVAVEGLVQDVIALVRADAVARHVALEFAAAPDLPIALGDRVHLSQVLLNLIINGMDAVSESREGSRRVVIDARRGDDGMLEVAVTDSGHGLAREVASKVFDPFFTTKAHGMGMGLPVSRTIVEAHGGKLWAESHATPGTTFRFTLPVAEVTPP